MALKQLIIITTSMVLGVLAPHTVQAGQPNRVVVVVDPMDLGESHTSAMARTDKVMPMAVFVDKYQPHPYLDIRHCTPPMCRNLCHPHHQHSSWVGPTQVSP